MTGSTSWEDPTTKHTYILIFHKSFYYEKKLNHSLINPKQVCYNDTNYWDKPKKSEWFIHNNRWGIKNITSLEWHKNKIPYKINHQTWTGKLYPHWYVTEVWIGVNTIQVWWIKQTNKSRFISMLPHGQVIWKLNWSYIKVLQSQLWSNGAPEIWWGTRSSE